MAALLPGMVHMLQLMEKYVNELRAELQALQINSGIMAESHSRRGRPPKAFTDAVAAATERIHKEHAAEKVKEAAPQETVQMKAQKGYWAKMTPAQRSAEMIRRQAVSTRKRKAAAAAPAPKPVKAAASTKRPPKVHGIHISNPAHPRHEAWMKKMRAVAKKRWAKVPKDQRSMGLPKAPAPLVNGAAAAA